jgi:hypothetical protein
MEKINESILQSILGYNESALELLEGSDKKELNTCLLKSNLLLNLGRSQEALKVLDEFGEPKDDR